MGKKVIEIIRDRGMLVGADHHICQITGERYVRKPTFYRHTKTGQEYCHVAGGIGWPGGKPGFIVIIGVEKSTRDAYFDVLEEVESVNINSLLKSCLHLREKYGFGKGSDLFKVWCGETDRFDSLVNDFNHNLDGKTEGIYLSPPHDYQKPNAFEIWLNTIRSFMKQDSSGNPKLFLVNCPILRNHIQSAPVDVAVKGSVEEYPALSCLGGTLHSLMISRPWLEYVRAEVTIPTIPDPLGKLVEDHERALWEVGKGSYDYDDMDEHDNGELIPTI